MNNFVTKVVNLSETTKFFSKIIRTFANHNRTVDDEYGNIRAIE